MTSLLRRLLGWNYVDRFCGHTFLRKPLNARCIVLDLGANEGAFSHGIIFKYGCHVYASEPLSTLRNVIMPSPQLTLLPYAIGGEDSVKTVKIFSSRCASLFVRENDQTPIAEEEVPIRKLHSILELTGADNISLLKLDIEGAEVEMFASASDEDLRRCSQITIEFHDFLYPNQGAQIKLIRQRLKAIGFYEIRFSLDNTDVLFLNLSANGIGILHYYYLKYITKYSRGLSRRFGSE